MTNKITIKYHSGRMLQTLDLPQLFQSLFEVFGECQINFIPMSMCERNLAEENVDDIDLVKNRFWIMRDVAGEMVRQQSIEGEVVGRGKK